MTRKGQGKRGVSFDCEENERETRWTHLPLPHRSSPFLFLLNLVPLLVRQSLGDLPEAGEESSLVLVAFGSEDGRFLASTDLDGVGEVCCIRNNTKGKIEGRGESAEEARRKDLGRSTRERGESKDASRSRSNRQRKTHLPNP